MLQERERWVDEQSRKVMAKEAEASANEKCGKRSLPFVQSVPCCIRNRTFAKTGSGDTSEIAENGLFSCVQAAETAGEGLEKGGARR